MSRVRTGAFVIAITVAGVSGCSSSSSKPSATTGAPSTTGAATTTPPPAFAPPLPGTNWNLASYLRASGMTTAAPGSPATLRFDDGGKLSGSTGCNSFNGSYTTNGNSLHI